MGGYGPPVSAKGISVLVSSPKMPLPQKLETFSRKPFKKRVFLFKTKGLMQSPRTESSKGFSFIVSVC